MPTTPIRLTAILSALAISGAALASSYVYERDVRAHNLAHGRVVFVEQCMHCHNEGRYGAPRIEDREDWTPRIRQSLATLIEHAVAGHGDMPAKGELDLSNQDVAAAVAYIVYRTRQSGLAIDDLPPTAAGGELASIDCAHERYGCSAEQTPPETVMLNMLWLITGQERWR